MGIQRVVVNATKDLDFKIGETHVALAGCGDPTKCVVAQALWDCLGDFFQGLQVGSNVTKIITSDKVIRYKTPAPIRKAIPFYDKTGKWDLPAGEYTLLPFIQRPPRRKDDKKRKKQRGMFVPRSIPSRRVMRVEVVKQAP